MSSDDFPVASPSAVEEPPALPGADVPLRTKAIRNSVITLGGYAASTGVRFASNLIITRLLIPEQFGIMALVNVFITGLFLFSDIGIGPNIIQSPRGDDPVFLNTAWTVQVLRGTTLWVAACALAWPLSRFYARPELLYLLPVVGLTAVIGGLESTRLFTQNRRLALGRVSLLELLSQVAGIVAMLVVAAATHSIWSLVVGALVSAVIKTVLSHAMLPGERNGFAWDASSRQALIDFGRWIFVSTAITFLSGQSDRLILAKLVSDSRLGLYAIAVNLAVLPSNIIGQLSQRVLYPIIADTLRRGGHDWSTIRKNHSRLLLVMAPIIAMGIALAAPAVSVMYRPAYWEVGPLTAYLTIGTWLGAVSTSYTVVLMAAGTPKYMTLGSIAKIILFSALVFFVSPRFGVAGVAVLVSLTELGYLVVAVIGCRQIGVVAWKSDLAITAFGALYLLVCKLLYEFALRSFHGTRIAAIAVVVVVTGGLTFGLIKRLKLL
jgi:O-antigen/teichoic acid export membrane protein